MGIHLQPAHSPIARVIRKVNHLVNMAPAIWPQDRAVVTFTFDDFPKSAAVNAAPILEQRGWRGTFYTCSGLEGRTNHLGRLWDAEDLVRLIDAGHEIGCHTCRHVDGARAKPDELLGETLANAQALERFGVKKPVSFAWPFGEANPLTRRNCATDFATLRGIKKGINHGVVDRSNLKATELDPVDASVNQQLIDEVVATGGWLIFFTHDVGLQPTRWGCHTDTLCDLLERVARAGLTVMTMEQAGRLLQTS